MNARFVAPTHIYAHPVPDWERRAFRIRFFGFDDVPPRHCVAHQLARYTGCETESFVHMSLSNGGMYFAPDLPAGTILQWRDGTLTRTCAARAAGIRASLIALNAMMHGAADSHYGGHYMRLHDYARQRPERHFILDGV